MDEKEKDNATTPEQALANIVQALPDVETFDSDISVIQTAINSPGSDGTDWKSKYQELSKKYKARFMEGVVTQPQEAEEKEEVVKDDPVTLEELNFSGETE